MQIFFLGFFIKIVTGFDDMITRVPVLSSVTSTRKGKIAFSVGVILAVSTATAIAFFFSSVLHQFPAYRYIVAVLVVLLALAIYFDLFEEKSRTTAKKRLVQRAESISLERATQLVGIGFFASILTVLDDVIAYLPVFLAEPGHIPFGILGILSATVAQAVVVICFAEKIDRIPHKEEIAAGGLLVLAVLIVTGVI